MGHPEQGIGDQVRLSRLEQGLTQEQLAQRSGVTLSTIRNIERGRTDRSYRLRDVLEVLGLVDLAEEHRIAARFMREGFSREDSEKAARIVLEMGPLPKPPAAAPGRDEQAAG